MMTIACSNDASVIYRCAFCPLKNMQTTMKRIMTLLALVWLTLAASAQANFYNEKLAEFAKMRPIDSTDVVMLGDDFIEYAGDWNVLLRARHIRNRGIAGDNIEGVARRVSAITRGKPKAIFLMVGAHDLLDGKTPADLLRQYEDVVQLIRRQTPKTKLFVESVLPVNETFGREDLKDKTNVVAQFNRLLRHYCERNSITYINLFRTFVRHGTYELRRELTQDGFALSPFGYKLWGFALKQYITE